MATKDGKIVDEINGIIASRDSIRSTMLDAGVNGVTDTSKLADLATNLDKAKLPASTHNISASGSVTIPAGKLTTGAQTITAKDLASQTPGTAAAADIRSGKTAYVKGTQLTGSMPNATITSGSATISSATYTYNSSNGNFSVTGSANVSAPTVGTAGYISSSEGTLKTNTGAAKLSATVAKIAGSTTISGTTTKQPSISRQAFTNISGITDAAADNATTTAPTSSSTYKAWVKVNSAANTGTLTATPSVTAAGYGTKDYHGIATASATVGALASADTYIPIKNGDYSASVSTTNGSASMSASGVSTVTSSNCYVTLSTTPGSAKGTATIGTGGYITAGSKESSASVDVSGNGDRLYLAINYYYTSLDAPSSTSGYNDGDIWLVVNP